MSAATRVGRTARVADARQGSPGPLTAGDVTDTARRIIESDGVDALTMRRLSEELGVAVTSIYWHVGRRDDVVAAVVEQFVTEMGALAPAGTTTADRIASVARDFRDQLLEHPHLVAVAYQRGHMAPILRPMRAVLLAEFASLGQRSDELARSILAIETHVVSSTLLAQSLRRNPPVVGAESWPAHGTDPELVEAYERLVGTSVTFEFGLEALITALVDRAVR